MTRLCTVPDHDPAPFILSFVFISVPTISMPDLGKNIFLLLASVKEKNVVNLVIIRS